MCANLYRTKYTGECRGDGPGSLPGGLQPAIMACRYADGATGEAEGLLR